MIRISPPRAAAPLAAWVLAALVLLGGCRNRAPAPEGPPETIPAGEGNRDWYAGTPEMQRKIAEAIAKIPASEGPERIELGQEIMSYGEPAVPQLVRALQAHSPETRGTAAWILGFSGDRRAVPALRRAVQDPAALVSYEAAASLVRLGDDQGLGRLIDGLADPDVRIRAKSFAALKARLGTTFGYKPDNAPEERAPSVARWRAWYEDRMRGSGA